MSVNLIRLKKLREEHGMSLAQVSERLGFSSQQGYYYKEKGSRAITADELGKLAALYGVPVGSLYTDNSQQTEEGATA